MERSTKHFLIVSAIILAVLAVVVIVVVPALAFGLLLHVSITVEDASLTKFALATSPTTTLAYNLSMTLTVRNPNWAIGIKYIEPFEAAYSFDGQQFDRVQIADSGDKHPARKTRVYHLVTCSASDYVTLGNAGVAEYKKANATGKFEVEVALTANMSYTARVTKCELEAKCPLKLRLAPPSRTTVRQFEKVKCKLTKSKEKYC